MTTRRSRREKIEDYIPLVTWVCQQCGVSASMRDDMVQEGLLGVLEAMKRYREGLGTSFDTYAVYWIRKRVREALERERRQSPQGAIPLEYVPAEQLVWEAPLEEGWLLNLVDQLDGELSTEEREVLRQLFEQGRTLVEVAAALGISRARVLQIRRRALKRLRRLVEGRETEGGQGKTGLRT